MIKVSVEKFILKVCSEKFLARSLIGTNLLEEFFCNKFLATSLLQEVCPGTFIRKNIKTVPVFRLP